MLFDEFESRRSSYISLLAYEPAVYREPRIMPAAAWIESLIMGRKEEEQGNLFAIMIIDRNGNKDTKHNENKQDDEHVFYRLILLEVNQNAE